MSVSEQITGSFNLPTDVISICDRYYILYWESRYVYSSLLRSPRIVRQGTTYVPILLDGLTLEYLGSDPELPIKLSFRRLRYKRTGYVLIARTAQISTSSSTANRSSATTNHHG